MSAPMKSILVPWLIPIMVFSRSTVIVFLDDGRSLQASTNDASKMTLHMQVNSSYLVPTIP